MNPVLFFMMMDFSDFTNIPPIGSKFLITEVSRNYIVTEDGKNIITE